MNNALRDKRERSPGTGEGVPHEKFPYRIPHVRAWKRGGVRAAPDAPWMLTYRDPGLGRDRTETASADVEVAATRAREISTRLDRQRLGQLDPRAERLLEHARRTPLQHLDDYRDWLIAKGRTDKQGKEVRSRCKKMIELCEFNTLDAIGAEELEMEVAETVRGEWDRSLKTCNDYLKSMQQFCRWMARPKIGRLRSNPLADVEKYNAATDPRHPRRALTPQQVLKVLEVTAARPPYVTRVGPPKLEISGPDRVMYYLVKVHTGIRNEEAASLTPESFVFDAFPVLTVEAAYSKHRRKDELPLAPGLVAQLKPWLGQKAAGQKLWALDAKPYRMWKADLEASGFAYCERGQFADLYSLRHTFATLVGKSADSLKTLQELMRHSDIRLTARYMHSTVFDTTQALADLPVPPPPRIPLAATGTDDAHPDQERLRLGLKRRSTEPKVAGSSPARCVRQDKDL